MLRITILEIQETEQAEMLGELDRWRYGYYLAIHILLLCARGKTPTEIAEFLFCSRSSVYRTVRSYKSGRLRFGSQAVEESGQSRLSRFERLVRSLIKQAPSIYGWCRTRWSCAALALTISARMNYRVSRERVRRELHAAGYVWKRAKLIAKDNDPKRAEKLAKIRYLIEHLKPSEALFFADELDIHLLPKVGYQWMLKGDEVEIVTPGQNQKQYLAAALNFRTGEIIYCIGERKTNLLFRQLLTLLEQQCRHEIKTVYVVADNYKIHKAQAVERWLATHPRFKLLFLPTYCPKANPIERVFWEVHDKCTRNHTRKRFSTLMRDVERHLQVNGPWEYKVSEIYYVSEVDSALTQLYPEHSLGVAA